MPVEKVPIVHKFGIISHSQRLELQERILKQSYLETLASRKIQSASRNPFEVTEEFVQQYNGTQSFDIQGKLEDTAHKMLERIKRKAGLKESGLGVHVDLPLAWTELSQLAQCKGQVQEECLNVMITSLDQAPLSKSHIPALFFLAETTLYWLRTDAINQPYLRTGELKLLKMGMLVFSRLFYHHMSGQLQGHDDFKNRLFTYLDGFADCQDAYSPYPNALLYIRYINEVGRMVIGDNHTEAGEVKEGDQVSPSQKETAQTAMSSTESDEKFLQSMCDRGRRNVTPSKSRSSLMTVMRGFFHDVSANYEVMSHSSHSGAISSSVHDLSPTLWHSLDVWRCVRQLSGGLTEAIIALGNCGMGLASESWVDGICAIQVLSDSAKANVKVLRTLQNLAKGTPPKAPTHLSDDEDATIFDSSTQKDQSTASKASKVSYATSSKFGLSDIYEKTEYDSSRSKSGDPRLTKVGSAETDARTTPSFESPDKMSKPPQSSRDIHGKPPSTREGGEKDSTDFSRNKTHDTMKTTTTGASRLQTGQTGQSGWRAELGTTEASGYGRNSAASSVPTYSNKYSTELSGIHGWHWEVAITYTEILADICLHGTSSNIHKVALLGNHRDDATDFQRIASIAQCPMKSAGLLDMVQFKAIAESDDGGPNDWSWRVRYTAIQGLVKICRCCAGDSTKEGLQAVAWNALMRAHSNEKDNRVLEALKVGQVDANIENLLSKHLAVPPSAIGAKIAAGLSKLYLPPLPKPVQSPAGKTPQRRSPQIQINKPFRRKPMRTSLKEEISLATALYEPPVPFEDKAGYDLRRIVEDQWRKELQIQLDDEEEERVKELKEKQAQEEKRETETEVQRKEKLKDKYKGKAYQYKDFPLSNNKGVKNKRDSSISMKRKSSLEVLQPGSSSRSLNSSSTSIKSDIIAH